MIKVGVFCDVENVVQFKKLLKFIRDEIGKEGKTLWKAVANLCYNSGYYNIGGSFG